LFLFLITIAFYVYIFIVYSNTGFTLITCGQPTYGLHAVVNSCTQLYYTQTCTPTCNTGYYGYGQLTCQSNAAWTGSVYCGLLPCSIIAPANGILGSSCSSGLVNDASSCTPICNSGYQLQGTVQSCSNAVLSPSTPPTCQPVNCGQPVYPPGSVLNSCSALTYTSVCVATCQSGWTTVSGSQTCSSTGIWTGTQVGCKPPVSVFSTSPAGATALVINPANTKVYISTGSTLSIYSSSGIIQTASIISAVPPTIYGMGIDVNQVIYLMADNGIYKYVPDATTYTPWSITTVSGVLNRPLAILFDPTGNAFVTNYAANTIVTITPGGSMTLYSNTAFTFSGPGQMVRDSNGVIVSQRVEKKKTKGYKHHYDYDIESSVILILLYLFLLFSFFLF
jgi:hypothetical protein